MSREHEHIARLTRLLLAPVKTSFVKNDTASFLLINHIPKNGHFQGCPRCLKKKFVGKRLACLKGVQCKCYEYANQFMNVSRS